MRDYLTWEGIRNLATCEALTVSTSLLAFATYDQNRPPVKTAQQRAWYGTAVQMQPGPGDIVFARTAWRAPWRSWMVQQIKAPVVLVSTFYDPMIKPIAVEEMFPLGSPIKRWFAVQVLTTHPLLTPMPLGVEGSIVPLLESTERHERREIPLYLNFARSHQGFTGDPLRKALWNHFAPLPWVAADPWTKGTEAHYVSQLGKSRFVLSPPGLAWDCYRTYEAIAMGAIPIVQRKSPATDVCEALPVLLVDDWDEVTPERLAHEWDARAPKDTRTLTLSYWRDRIQATARRLAEDAVYEGSLT